MNLTAHEPHRGTAVATEATANEKAEAGMDILYQAKLERYFD
jgi:hypothetical protein